MHLQSNARERTDEYRRYFPDWTHRSLRGGEELEADHNSYLAGGYAEEFGYLAQAESSRGVPLIDGESPDDYALRLVQRAGMLRAIRSGPIRSPWSEREPPAVELHHRHRTAYRATGRLKREITAGSSQ